MFQFGLGDVCLATPHPVVTTIAAHHTFLRLKHTDVLRAIMSNTVGNYLRNNDSSCSHSNPQSSFG